VICLVVMYVRFPLSLRNVEDLLLDSGIDLCHETVRDCWKRFGPLFAGDIRRQQVSRMRGIRQWHWHIDERAPCSGSGECSHCRSSPQFTPTFTTISNQERQPVDRQTYKDRRSAALAEWQLVMTLSLALKAPAPSIGDELRLD
jgi:hypothetical protein